MSSALGTIRYRVSDRGLCALDFASAPAQRGTLGHCAIESAADRAADRHGVGKSLASYLSGDLQALAGIPLDVQGTPFEERVWRELRRIPCGSTLSYAELAQRIGRPTAVRAVARANARNRVAIVIPCHRVIGADGSLTGYAYGLTRKHWLLAHEGALAVAH